MVELEPFKTAITLSFMRSWPFVVYTVALLLANAVVYKLFCCCLCLLGANLALLGRFRIFSWLPWREQCGMPWHSCRHHCEYEAIGRNDRIGYDDCFQCMDCVVIYRGNEQCAPLMLEKKRGHMIPIHAAIEKQ